MKSRSTTREAEIVRELIRMAIARGTVLDDAQAEVYLDALADLDTDNLVDACRRFALEPRAEFSTPLPTVGDLRLRVGVIARERHTIETRRLHTPPADADDPRTWYACPICRDSGWESLQCEGDQRCGRLTYGRFVPNPSTPKLSVYEGKCAGPHAYVRRCACRLKARAREAGR